MGIDPNGQPVYLEDLWPSHEQIDELVKTHVKKEFYEDQYARIFDGDRFWDALDIAESTTFAWNEDSTYIKNPPYFDGFSLTPQQPGDIIDARCFLLLGDTVTTDHISPAGAIPEDYPAGQYLIEHGVAQDQFNSYGSRRGNHEVMMRGTFGNIRIKNRLVDPKQGSFTLKFPEKTEMFNYDAAMAYQAEGTPLIVLGGKEYGTGSSRDWAAKGHQPAGHQGGHRPVLRTHPPQQPGGHGRAAPGVCRRRKRPKPWAGWVRNLHHYRNRQHDARKQLAVKAVKPDGSEIDFKVTSRLDTEVDVEYFENGGILPCVIRKMMAEIGSRRMVGR